MTQKPDPESIVSADANAPAPEASDLVLPGPFEVAEIVRSVCPYLVSRDGGWRSSEPTREHRCTAVTPPAALASDKQRRLCLAPAYRGCATYLAARATHADGERPLPAHRPFLRTTPVVLDRGGIIVAVPSMAAGRGIGQIALVASLLIAFIAVVLAGGFGDEGRVPAGGVSPTPTTVAVLPTPTPSPAPPSPSPSPVPATPTPEPTVDITPTPSESPSPTGSPRTYRVRSGDTLSAIASRFGTTVKVLADLNGISDPSRLRVGQVLILP